jgi:hypothetical protein
MRFVTLSIQITALSSIANSIYLSPTGDR